MPLTRSPSYVAVVQTWCMIQPGKSNTELGDVQLWITFSFSWLIMGLQVLSATPSSRILMCVYMHLHVPSSALPPCDFHWIPWQPRGRAVGAMSCVWLPSPACSTGG